MKNIFDLEKFNVDLNDKVISYYYELFLNQKFIKQRQKRYFLSIKTSAA